MRKNNRLLGLFVAGVLVCGTAAAGTVNAPVIIPLQNGSQAAVALSNTEPNLFSVPGDSVVAVSGIDESLVRYAPTANGALVLWCSGALVLSTLNKKPFTFVIETARGLNFSLRAVPQAGSGRTFSLVGEGQGVSAAAKVWEQSQPYESMLVALNQALITGRLPAGYGEAPATHERLPLPAGLRAEALRVWKGHRLKVVRFMLTNPGTTPVRVNEPDFWQPGVRAVMFDTPTREIVPAGRMDVLVTLSGEAADGQH